jgi:hypothetical protein
MPTYRLRGSIVTAVQFFAKNKPWPKGVEVVGEDPAGPVETGVICLRTGSGWALLKDTDWLVLGSEGRYHLVPDFIFSKEYELLES